MIKTALIEFLSPVKVGRGENYVDAITIYRALVNVLFKLGYEDLINDFINRVTVSSILPAIRTDSKTILFLKSPSKVVDCDDRRMEKEIKSADYLDYELLTKNKLDMDGGLRVRCNKFYEGGAMRVEVEGADAVVMNGFIIESQNYKLIENSKRKDLLGQPKQEVRYRNVIDRVTNAAVPFTVTAIMPTTEMAILMQVCEDGSGKQGEQLVKVLEDAIKVLGEVGIGGERSVGYGRFRLLEFRDFDGDLNAEIKLRNKRAYYVTGRAYIEGGSDFLAGRFDVVKGFAGEVFTSNIPLLVLLPAGSIVTSLYPCFKYHGEGTQRQLVVIKPLTIPPKPCEETKPLSC
ncbi:MAG: type III-A CRISPR-associated RAMP protein Csm4 [Vulcanisaeta sp.]